MQFFGRIRNDERTLKYVQGLKNPRLRDIPRAMAPIPRQTTSLWKPLLKCQPDWRRGQQAIGDCVSWGCELACTLNLAQQAQLGQIIWKAPANTESIYGGCRVEIAGGEMGNEDGAMGVWAADWVHKFGVLLREDYSKITGNPDHDMRVYDESGRKAKEFGYYGNGGKNDEGKLDALAKEHPIADVTLVSSVEELIAALLRGCPVTVASGVGYEGSRNSEGIIRRRGDWGHQMCYWGISFTPNGDPLFDLCNSWRDSPVHGPYPGVDEEAVKLTSWRVVPEDAEKQLREQDSFAMSRVLNFDLPPFNFHENLFV